MTVFEFFFIVVSRLWLFQPLWPFSLFSIPTFFVHFGPFWAVPGSSPSLLPWVGGRGFCFRFSILANLHFFFFCGPPQIQSNKNIHKNWCFFFNWAPKTNIFVVFFLNAHQRWGRVDGSKRAKWPKWVIFWNHHHRLVPWSFLYGWPTPPLVDRSPQLEVELKPPNWSTITEIDLRELASFGGWCTIEKKGSSGEVPLSINEGWQLQDAVSKEVGCQHGTHIFVVWMFVKVRIANVVNQHLTFLHGTLHPCLDCASADSCTCGLWRTLRWPDSFQA